MGKLCKKLLGTVLLTLAIFCGLGCVECNAAEVSALDRQLVYEKDGSIYYIKDVDDAACKPLTVYTDKENLYFEPAFSKDKETLYFVTSDEKLRMVKVADLTDDVEKNKKNSVCIAKKVFYFMLSEVDDKVFYVNWDLNCYYYDGERSTLACKSCILYYEHESYGIFLLTSDDLKEWESDMYRFDYATKKAKKIGRCKHVLHEDENGILYTRGDRTKDSLYYLKFGEKSKKIATNINVLSVSADGNRVYYTKAGKDKANLICYTLGKGKRDLGISIKENYDEIIVSDDGTDMIVFKGTGKYPKNQHSSYLHINNGYHYHIGKKVKKIAKIGQVYDWQIGDRWEKDRFYFSDRNGNYRCYANGKSKVLLRNAQSVWEAENGIRLIQQYKKYGTIEDTYTLKIQKNDKISTIAKDVSVYQYVDAEHIYYMTSDGTLYLYNKDGQNICIAHEITDYVTAADKL